MSPRIDHRPPVIAFVVLVVLAIGIIGTNARALDRVVVAGDPLAVHVRVSGTAPMGAATTSAAERVRPLSRVAVRVAVVPSTDPAPRSRADAARTQRTSTHPERATEHRAARPHGLHLGRALGRTVRLLHGLPHLGRAFAQH